MTSNNKSIIKIKIWFNFNSRQAALLYNYSVKQRSNCQNWCNNPTQLFRKQAKFDVYENIRNENVKNKNKKPLLILLVFLLEFNIKFQEMKTLKKLKKPTFLLLKKEEEKNDSEF